MKGRGLWIVPTSLALITSCSDLLGVDWDRIEAPGSGGGGGAGEVATGGGGGRVNTAGAAGSEGGSDSGGNAATAGFSGSTGTGGDGAGGSGASSGFGGSPGTSGHSGASGSPAGGTAGALGGGGSGGVGGSVTAGAGGSAPVGGTSGTGGPCGDGVVEEPEVCDIPYTVNDCGGDCLPITTPECLDCELTEPSMECVAVVDCEDVTGVATAGPAAGIARSYLCNETLDCVRRSNCALGQLIDCYCGSASAAQCDAGQGNGACRAALERGYESTNPIDVVNRFTAPGFGAGFAMLRVGCDQAYCFAECF